MFKIFLLLFITIPLLELYVLIEVGSGLGGITTIALCLLTAALGGILIRWQGMQTLLSAQRQMAQGQPPAEQALHGILLALAGLMLFLPGFITDTLGFLLLIPALRRLVFLLLLKHQPKRQQAAYDDGIIDAEIIEITTKRRIDEHH